MWLLFVGDRYYPFGGAEDLLGIFDTVDEAKKFAEPQMSRELRGSAWAQIFNPITLEVWRREDEDDDRGGPGQWECSKWFTQTHSDGEVVSDCR